MEIVDDDVDAFLEGFEDPEIAATMRRLDELIVTAMPGRRRVLWVGRFWGGTDQSIVGYGDLRQPRPRGPEVEWFIVGLARQSRNYSLYVNAVVDGAYLGKKWADRLGKVKVGSASLGFRSLDVVEVAALSAMFAEAHELTPPDPPG